jgi:hypothetical protein
MNKGVEILLARMETHPEEFEQDSKWVGMFNEYKKYMEPEEQTAVLEKLRQLKMDKFEELIVKRLMREKRELEPIQSDLFGNSGSPYITMNTTGRAIFANTTLTIGNQTLEEQDIEQMKRMLVEKLAKVDR